MVVPSLAPLPPAILLLLAGPASAALLLDEDFSCASIGCNSTHGITNYSYWRWATTGSAQSMSSRCSTASVFPLKKSRKNS